MTHVPAPRPLPTAADSDAETSDLSVVIASHLALLLLGHPRALYNEYGSVVSPGWELNASGEKGVVRVSYHRPQDDLADPDRVSRAEWAARELAVLDWVRKALESDLPVRVTRKYIPFTGRTILLVWGPCPSNVPHESKPDLARWCVLNAAHTATQRHCDRHGWTWSDADAEARDFATAPKVTA